MADLLSECTEVLRQRNDITKFFRRNACARHGVPWDEKEQPLEIQHEHKHTHESPPVSTERIVKDVAEELRGDESLKGPPGETPVVPVDRIIDEVSDRVRSDPSMRGPRGERGDPGERGSSGNGKGIHPGWLLAAITAAGLSVPAGAFVLRSGGGSGGDVPAVESPDDPGTDEPSDSSGSLLQHLEDTGRHLPSRSD